MIGALSSFSYDDDIKLPDHSGREIAHQYQDKMFYHVPFYLARKFFLPFSIASIYNVIKGIKSLLSGHLDVAVHDGTSISAALLSGDFNTAGSVMFLLGVSDIMEEWTRRKSMDDLASAMSLHVEKV